ncbi:MAG: ATP-binding cassette domain-containing protein [Holosporaceae bacterium]|jgi:putative ABC transport system ATP-binding protein|nr:ATP-binding cassette domain-containing protein [Holosporaceae bacterium]
MIRVEDIFVVFCSGTPLERIALRGINFTAKDGEIVTIVGNSGSGRTTLLRFLAGHITSNFGRLWFNKVNITGQSLIERSNIFSSVFYDQDTGTAANLTVLENLAVASLHHQSKSFIEPAITAEMRELFIEQLREVDFMGMEELADMRVADISKPHRQVLALMIAVIKDAKVLLIDEHSTGLDRESTKALLETTEKIIKSKKITTIMALSDPKFALEISDRTLVLSHGQVVSDLGEDEKKNMKLDDLFASFNVVPPIKEAKLVPSSGKSR